MNSSRLVRLSMDDIDMIKAFFFDVFTAEPWCDDWSDDAQLTAYITDLIGDRGSLTYGLYRGDELVGLSMGHIKHWYKGTEYYIEEFCIRTDLQCQGLGSTFIAGIEKGLTEMNIHSIFLQTGRDMPAYEFYRKRGFTELVDHVSFARSF